jgi:hypothetical protein
LAVDNEQDRKASMINALALTRRETLLLGATALTSSLGQEVKAGQDPERHGVSAFGDLKYPPNFKHFDYVNPNAPKGGMFSHVGATRRDRDVAFEGFDLISPSAIDQRRMHQVRPPGPLSRP